MILRLVMILGFLGLIGCGGGSSGSVDMGSPEGKLIAECVENFNDSAGNVAKLNKSFANGSAPTVAKKFAGLAFYVVGKPSVTGEQATCKVRVEKANNGNSLGEQDWSFVKEGSEWKIKSAPIP